ncbi:protein kinase [Nocardiopsis sp. L17-MgMaSL7]|uniref:protein kinase n=1 Tax=Nocardiopsis sp. L17-MgMaSL7 TaxID=1938893 RepID=UPI000D713D6F|nr:protein kinase [Nocardiopsis sp. L17-MgMaSL7]PWV45518.1 serine/threonine protein kinase [Nocardiopsis sp. L17-MgMaSL7]
MFPLHPHDPPSVGPHRLYARLGEDAYARVYLGASRADDPVAVKVVRPEYATDPAFRSSFAHQVESARGLEGPHVCGVRDADPRGAVPWVAVSRPLGPSLAELVNRHGPLPVDALHPLALALAQGLEGLHSSNRAHGSLWPDGVLVSADTALLADPGLEWAIGDTRQRAPHPAFAAPEGGAAPATDVFSWASTLCFAASGVEGPEGLARVPLQLRGLIDACLKRDPRLRPSSHDLVRMLGGPADPTPWSPRVRAAIDTAAAAQASMLQDSDATPGDGGPSSRKRGRLLAVGAGVLALVVLAGTGAVYARHHLGGDPPDPEASGAEAGAGLVSETGCLDGAGYPVPEEPLPEDTKYWDPAFSADGDLLTAASSAGLTVWDWNAGELTALPMTNSTYGVDTKFSPVGCTMSTAESVEYEGREHTVKVGHTYDLSGGSTTEHLGPQEGPDDSGRWLLKPRDVEAMNFSPDGALLAVTLSSTGQTASTVVIDTATGEAGEPMAPGLHYSTVFVDERHFATNSNGEIHVWDAQTGEEAHSLAGASNTRLAVVPGETQVAYLEGDQVVIRDYTTGAAVTSFTREEFETDDDPMLTRLLVDAERDRVYATWQVGTGPGSWRFQTYVWDLDSGENLVEGKERAGAYSVVAPHPDGGTLAAVTAVESDLVLIDPDTFEVVRELT